MIMHMSDSQMSISWSLHDGQPTIQSLLPNIIIGSRVGKTTIKTFMNELRIRCAAESGDWTLLITTSYMRAMIVGKVLRAESDITISSASSSRSASLCTSSEERAIIVTDGSIH